MNIPSKNLRWSLGVLAATCLFSTASAEPVVVAGTIPYSENSEVQRKIRDECTELNSQLAQFIQQYAGEKGVEVAFGDASADTGRVLRVEITNAVSQGNAFIGHNKGTTARGTLFQDGAKVADFKAARYSMGGAFAGFKGSCSVLGRTVRAMGEDIGRWLANPVDGAELGDQ